MTVPDSHDGCQNLTLIDRAAVLRQRSADLRAVFQRLREEQQVKVAAQRCWLRSPLSPGKYHRILTALRSLVDLSGGFGADDEPAEA